MPAAVPLPRVFSRIPLDEATSCAAALIAIDVFRKGLSARQSQRLLGRHWDDDWYALMGVECVLDDNADALIDREPLRTQMQQRQRMLKAQGDWLQQRQARSHNALAAQLHALSERLRLEAAERDVLYLGVLIQRFPALNDLFQAVAAFAHGQPLSHVFAAVLGHERVAVGRAMGRQGQLARFGMIDPDHYNGVVDVSSSFISWLAEGDEGVERFIAQRLRRAAEPALGLDDFRHVPDVGRLRQYLRVAIAERHRGVNILIHGQPGTGKTELVRALVADLGLRLFEVPVEDIKGEAVSGQRRFSALSLAQRLLARQDDVCLLFDEIEDVFGYGGGQFDWLFGREQVPVKGWLNDQLEHSAIPTFWLSNRIGSIDPAHLRRFDEVIELRPPPARVRRTIVARYFGEGLLSDACTERIAQVVQATPAHIERAARVVQSLRGSPVQERDAAAVRVLENSLRAMGVLQRLPEPALPGHYDPEVLNTGTDVQQLLQNLRCVEGARLCFHGPPGTGKTAFAHYLAGELEKPLLVRRASDLLSKWLGGTEANIAAAFQQAADEEAVLLIDEVDGFLRDRGKAERSWQVTQVNEFLTQMEAFGGVFIASTNLMAELDAASLRRFDHKLYFDYLRRPQRRRLFEQLCRDLATDSGDHAAWQQALAKVEALHLLTPGDFATVRRQLRGIRGPVRCEELAQRLNGETAIKPEGRQRAIGFRIH